MQSRNIPGSFFALLLASALSLCGAGCREETTSESTSSEVDASPSCCTKVTRANLLAKARATESEPEAPATVNMKTVKLAQLAKELHSLSDKVVVLDVWADFCLPCKKTFPHLVEMHRRFAKDGLVCISVCVDEPQDAESALAFLRKQQATFANYRLDEPAEAWQEHFNITAIPAVFVYQDGKKVAQFDNDNPRKRFTYDDVEKAAVKLLRR